MIPELVDTAINPDIFVDEKKQRLRESVAKYRVRHTIDRAVKEAQEPIPAPSEKTLERPKIKKPNVLIVDSIVPVIKRLSNVVGQPSKIYI